ncbi:MAG: hypothetical protein R2779_04295 [Crocinitomicaceae bacterium]
MKFMKCYSKKLVSNSKESEKKNIIAYFNAKGDVIMTAYDNNCMTRQLYDNRTFLLKRTRTSPYIQTGWTFADNAGVKEDKSFLLT